MNFFEQQARAQRNSLWLVVLLVLAVVSLIVMTTGAVLAILYLLNGVTPGYVQVDGSGNISTSRMIDLLNAPLVGGIALTIMAVVVLGIVFKRLQLMGGGAAVAEAMGGRLINISTNDAAEQRVLNVVEEMAIASGTPVPPVYVLDDDAINAFAAGYAPQDAVIGVTRGTVNLLSRNELQGVIAHEFSHIFHGDMRLNIRLVALLNGILVLGLLGQMLVRSVRYRRIGGSRNSKDNSVAIMLSLGAALMVIGYAGTFFGNLIKAAVSRQREFLADASAVQFTRDPDGIGGALKKIGGHLSGSQVQALNAAEYSHLFFGQGVKTAFASMMATHPPLGERIRRVQPNWDGRFTPVVPSGMASNKSAEFVEQTHAPRPDGLAAFAPHAAMTAIDSVGEPQAEHLAYAQHTLAQMDDGLRQAAHDPYSARAIIYGLLLSPAADLQARQMEALVAHADPQVFALLQRLAPRLISLDPAFRLPLVELCLPALKQLSLAQHRVFMQCLSLLIKADGVFSLAEWSLYRVVVHGLNEKPVTGRRLALANCADDVANLLRVVAQAGAADAKAAKEAYEAAVSNLPFALTSFNTNAVSMAQLNKAVARLQHVKPLEKPRLLKALARCIEHDGRIAVREAEVFRAVADALDCPMPPLLADQTLKN
ncbi:M48 family metallopeptidase [Salinispirillum marinum]|uniref:M48 family metallopeptidase n=2 Tax=Saccharospirillaceae TaxID=255527 RepID=A0ABV8BBJ3_9GAMM